MLASSPTPASATAEDALPSDEWTEMTLLRENASDAATTSPGPDANVKDASLSDEWTESPLLAGNTSHAAVSPPSPNDVADDNQLASLELDKDGMTDEDLEELPKDSFR